MTAQYDQFEFVDDDSLNGERVMLRYIPVQDAVLWEGNSKLHDIGALITSIEEHGFRDPPAWDSKLGAIVEGNGRTTALQMMEQQGRAIPRGIVEDENGRWCMPVLFGLDAKSQIAATKYGIDHNNLTMLGGDFTLHDISRMWDTEKYILTLDELASHNEMPVSIGYDDLEFIKDAKLRKTSEMEDAEPEEGDQSDSNKEESDGAVLIVNVANFNLIDDVHEAIEELLYANPGWDAKVVRN